MINSKKNYSINEKDVRMAVPWTEKWIISCFFVRLHTGYDVSAWFSFDLINENSNKKRNIELVILP